MELLILVVLVLGFFLLSFLLLQKKDKSSSELLEIVKMLQNTSVSDRKMLLTNLQENTRSLNERLDRAAHLMGEVQRNVGEVSEIGRSMKELQEFLQSPKLRGNIGEQVLKEILSQMLPKSSFHLQYSFKSGAIVDAAITTQAGIIPIDSKFPMENFRKLTSENGEAQKQAKKAFIRDVRSHIDAISKKYIVTEEGTIDYALMYVPSEAVYYEIVNENELFEYASNHRVLPVSPTTFYAYMKAILMSFEGQKVEEQALQMIALVRAIQKDYEKVEDQVNTLQKHITNASNMMNSVSSGFSSLGQKLNSTLELTSEAKRSGSRKNIN